MEHDAGISLRSVAVGVVAAVLIGLVAAAGAASAPVRTGTIAVTLTVEPADDDGTFTLEINSASTGQPVARVDGAADGGGITATTVPTGDYLVRQLGYGPTSLASYQQIVSCGLGEPDAQGWYRVTVGTREAKVCAFQDFRIPTLRLAAVVPDDSGGTATPTDFILAATGVTPDNGVSGSGAAASTGALRPDTFALSATGPAGYATTWECLDGGTPVNSADEVTLNWGDDVTCTATIDDVPPLLTLIPSTINDHGGTVDGADVPVSAVGDRADNGLSGTGEVTSTDTLLADTFTLAQVTPPGYAPGPWSCVRQTPTDPAPVPVELGGAGRDRLSLGIADTATCTVSSDDVAPQLTLVAAVVNRFGGTASPQDFALLAEGQPGNAVGGSGVVSSGPSLKADEFDLSETGPDGYDGTWTCAGGRFANDAVSLDVGQIATCTVTNVELEPDPLDGEWTEPEDGPWDWEIAPPRALRGTAILRGPRGCVSAGTVATRVTGRNMARIRFVRDGRTVRYVRVHSSRRRTFMLRTTVRAGDTRVHVVRAVVRFTLGAQPARTVLTQRFGWCAGR